MSEPISIFELDSFFEKALEDESSPEIILKLTCGHVKDLSFRENMLTITSIYGKNYDDVIINFENTPINVELTEYVQNCAIYDTPLTIIDAKSVEFKNCLFKDSVKIKFGDYIHFTNCFFLKDVECTGVTADCCIFERCIVGGNLHIQSTKINSLYIDYSNVLGTTWLEQSWIDQILSIRTYHGRDMIIKGLTVNGDCIELSDVQLNNHLQITNCIFNAHFIIHTLYTDDLTIVDSKFKKTVLDCIFIYNSDYEVPEIENATTIRNVYKNKDTTIRNKIEGVNLHSCYFDGSVILSNVFSSIVNVTDCTFSESVKMCKQEKILTNEYFYHYNFKLLKNQTIGIMGLTNSFFDHTTTIDNIFCYMIVDETQFNGLLHIDPKYLFSNSKFQTKTPYRFRITSDNPVNLKRISDSQSLLLNTKISDQFLIAYNVCSRQISKGCKKIKFYAHGIISNYGVSHKRLIAFMSLLLVIYAICYLSLGLTEDPIDAFYMSGITFFTVGFGVVGTMNEWLKIVAVSEGALGAILTAYLVVILCRRK